VHGALVSAVDHLDALRALVADAHVVHARAAFTLMRAAIENAATAVWLLGPSSRDERILRRLRLAWADSRDLDQPTFTSIVEAAGSDAWPEGLSSDLSLVCWMVASGMAHARLWAALSSVMDRTDVPGASTPATTVMRLSASDTALAAIAQVATSMTAAGWRLYDQRRSDPRQPAT
jgi:hypothetical protein